MVMIGSSITSCSQRAVRPVSVNCRCSVISPGRGMPMPSVGFMRGGAATLGAGAAALTLATLASAESAGAPGSEERGSASTGVAAADAAASFCASAWPFIAIAGAKASRPARMNDFTFIIASSYP